MREEVTREKIRQFMRDLGTAARGPARIFLTGGGTAVMTGWRPSTVDIDIKIVPDRDEILRAIPALKESLSVNVELASPDLFIPELPGWESRSLFVERTATIDWYHYDPYAQVLAKVERGHARDLVDVAEMLKRGMVEPAKLKELFEQIRPQLFRFPAVDPDEFESKLGEALKVGK